MEFLKSIKKVVSRLLRRGKGEVSGLSGRGEGYFVRYK